MAGSRHTPAWMSALIVLSGFAVLTAVGFYLHYYSTNQASYQEWHRANERRIALETAKLPLDEQNEALKDDIERHLVQLERVRTNYSDEAGESGAIASLIGNEAVAVQAIGTQIERIETKRRNLMQTLDEVREEWSREEDLKLSNAAEHEQSLRRLRDQVKQISHEIEREQKNARTIENSLERDIARLEQRVQELLNQKEITRNELRSDGTITAARADLGFVIIDLGWENNLRPGTKFSVFSNRAGRNVVKGSVQVLRVEEGIAHARILQEVDAHDPIIAGDNLHNPIYDPNDTKVFVIKGDFYRYSPAELARFIREAGGEVETELSTRTNYLVAGENSDTALEQAANYGVIILSENKLIEFIRMPTTAAPGTLDLARSK